MANKIFYICSECGARSLRWQGQCPKCNAWNTLEQSDSSAKSKSISDLNKPIVLSNLPLEGARSFTSGMQGLDLLLGKGIMAGAVILLGGEPGVGKSTLLLQLAASVAEKKERTVYISGEESLEQLQGRAQRLKLLNSGLQALASTRVEDLLAIMDDKDTPSLLIVDSVQTLGSAQIDGAVGSVTQVRAVSSMLIEKAKQTGCAVILVGHVTKEGQIAGPKLLEHMVDTVLYLEGDRQNLYRMLRVVKNRFGPSNELLLFEMKGSGMGVVHDPSTFFLQDRDVDLSGTALVMAVESRRPFAVEIQALASKTFLTFPRRTALGFDSNRLNLLLAVMEKRLRLNLGQMDIYAKVGGGLRLQDPGLDLGLVAAILSSFYDRPLPRAAVFWGEVDLNGQIRPVFGQDIRHKQATRLGYEPVFSPQAQSGKNSRRNLMELQRKLFGKQ